MLGCALFPLIRDAQLRYFDQTMNDSVGSVQMELLPSPFFGSCPFLNYTFFMLLCAFALSHDGYGIFIIEIPCALPTMACLVLAAARKVLFATQKITWAFSVTVSEKK